MHPDADSPCTQVAFFAGLVTVSIANALIVLTIGDADAEVEEHTA
jgi:hypothetical protein